MGRRGQHGGACNKARLKESVRCMSSWWRPSKWCPKRSKEDKSLERAEVMVLPRRMTQRLSVALGKTNKKT